MQLLSYGSVNVQHNCARFVSVFDLLKVSVHRIHSFDRQSALVALYVYDSLKRTGSYESFVRESDYCLLFVSDCKFGSIIAVNSSAGNVVRVVFSIPFQINAC